MPHIIIEHSQPVCKDLRECALAHALHQLVLDTGHFSPDAVKTRTIAYEACLVGEAAQAFDFVHVTVKILEGRDESVRSKLADDVFAALKEKLPNISKISVDVHEMNKATYRK